MVVVVMLGLGVTAGGLVRVGRDVWSIVQPMSWAASWLTIRAIEFRGVRQVPVEELRRLLPFREGDGLLSISPQTAVRRLSMHPWVASATLSRVLPDRVVIRVVERQPVAMLRDRTAVWSVDAGGVLLGPAAPHGAGGIEFSGVSLAQLQAGAAPERQRLREALALAEVLRRDGINTAAIAMRADEGAVVSLGAYQLRFGTGHYQEQWNRFVQVADRISAGPTRPREIDLRFTDSVVVRL
jgi:cell division protein FtsQ